MIENAGKIIENWKIDDEKRSDNWKGRPFSATVHMQLCCHEEKHSLCYKEVHIISTSL